MAEDRSAPYRALLGSRIRSQLSYRASFAADLLANVGIGAGEFVTLYVVFSRANTLGGLDVWQACLVFALANVTFAVGDLLLGHVDNLPTHVRTGTLDAFLLRPLPVLTQLATSDVSLKRIGRVLVAAAVFAVAWPHTGVELDARAALLLLVAVVGGTGVFTAVFVVAGALQFWLLDGKEAVNSITYGGSNAAQYPASLYSAPLRWLFCYVVPAAFVAYLPVLALLGEPGPAGLPAWLGWFSPVAAAAVWGIALLLWRRGVRHYTGSGS
ncbi:ABC transporter permease [Kineococcus rhizosphaerae]|uniref:ABC-2 type transport system permease protein n=1 Tax=Kineococcus rhizosphaerae TaxID=559628 RepID=A0A2T0R6F3_9ACTN|nr:ABC-2 family transporter protein [Kineococcus rhizosphaerae]PRY16754.1 ABC-2 type transport system permease protein [Kineococcus rhizosphaerae]